MGVAPAAETLVQIQPVATLGVSMPSWLRTFIQHVKCSQYADTCSLCAEWKAAAKAKNAARVEELTRPR